MNAAELLALIGFAVAQPVYALVADNPTFLVAHRVDGLAVLWYALALLLVPTALLLAFEAVVVLVHPPALRFVHAGLAGLFVGLAVTPPLARALSLGAVAWLVAFAAIAAGVALLRATRALAASVLRFAALAAPAFLILFLMSSGIRELLVPSDAAAVAAPSSSGTSVMWLVFDELPVGELLDQHGGIDRERYPGFASLADVSTWYPAAVASSSRTNVSVLSALTGQHPSNERVLPVGSQHPVNAFSLLGGGHDMQVHEAVTQLCPRSLCPDQASSVDEAVLWSDTWTIFVRSVTPDTVADRFVPETGDRWLGFGDNGVQANGAEGDDASSPGSGTDPNAAGVDEIASMDELFDRADKITSSDQRPLMDALVDSIGPTVRPTFTFVHALMPHIPYRYLPGGLAYDRVGSYGAIDRVRWVDDQVPIDHMMQRMMLQTGYVDEQVTRVVERLEATGRLDDTMVVVMSDHGVSMTPGTLRREYEAGTLDDMLPIPLFVHYPGQSEARVDRRPAQPIDLLPTVVDVVGVDVPASHHFDGSSLLGPSDGTAERTSPDGVVPLEPIPDVLSGRIVALREELFPEGTDLYRPRPYGDLVGQPLPTGAPAATDLVADISGPGRYGDVDPDSGVVPAHVVGTLDGRDEAVDLAVGVGGRLAGVGRTYRTDDGWQIAVMVDPDLFVAGRNDLTVWEIRPDGLRSVPTAD